jgi:hypothetical protein
VSWAAHEFENYFLQKHVGLKASFLAIVAGSLLSDLFTKAFVYASDEPAAFHRGWPGVGFSHSLIWGFGFAVGVLAVTRSRSWALGLLIGQWAHVFTDVADTAGVMVFFPFSTEPVTISMWKHAAVEGPWGDAAAYYSSLGGVWDVLWLSVVVFFAWKTLAPTYFRTVIVPADPRPWGWLQRRLRLPEAALLLIYWGFLFYGLSRMVSWFIYARTGGAQSLDIVWSGPEWVQGNDLSDAGLLEVLSRTAVGGLFFVAFILLCWNLFVRRLWERAEDPPLVVRGPRPKAALGD